jgi:hypothetical protein
MLDQKNDATGGANGSIMVGMFVCLCLASKKPSEREYFVPARMDLGVKVKLLKYVNYPDFCKNCFFLKNIILIPHRFTIFTYLLTKSVGPGPFSAELIEEILLTIGRGLIA